MEIKLRKLDPNDWIYFAKWWRDKELISLTSGDFKPLSDDNIKNQVKAMVKDKNAWHWMIKADNKIVGHINLNKLGDHKAELQIVIGEKDYWGRGIGNKAAKEILNAAKQLGFQKIKIEVRSENSRAINLYYKLGFKNLGLKKYPSNPNLPEVVIMQKEI